MKEYEIPPLLIPFKNGYPLKQKYQGRIVVTIHVEHFGAHVPTIITCLGCDRHLKVNCDQLTHCPINAKSCHCLFLVTVIKASPKSTWEGQGLFVLQVRAHH